MATVRRSVWLLAGAVVLGGVLLTRTTAGRRLMMSATIPSAPSAVAAQPTDLLPTFDGPDLGRPRVAVRLVPILRGIEQPTDIAAVPGHPDRAVVLSKSGTAWLATLSTGEVTPWFRVEVETASEMGLLGLAFSPTFTTDGTFFVDSNPALVTRIGRWRTDPGTLTAPREVGVVLDVDQPYKNHNAGQIAFGPDGFLYVGLGDGGFRDDPHGHGQDLGTLLGSLLRLDVSDATVPYRVPPDNPFVGRDGARPEIWARGLRNPWRFTFDPRGRLVVADVGQNRFEEIDLVSRGDNLGWNVREAEHCFAPKEGCASAGFVDPVWSYGRDEGLSVTGGVVWTGGGPLAGRYLFADHGSGRLWAMELPDTVRRVTEVAALGRFDLAPTAFGRAPDGSVWVCDYRTGAVYAIVVES